MSEDYIRDVLVTESCDWDKVQSRLNKPQVKRLLHAAMGMVTEAGELMDMLKKHIYYGKELDLVNVEEELGDSNWYQSIAIDALRQLGYDTSWNQIWEKNIAKLKKRYEGKFKEEKALNRDLEAERSILESSCDVCKAVHTKQLNEMQEGLEKEMLDDLRRFQK